MIIVEKKSSSPPVNLLTDIKLVRIAIKAQSVKRAMLAGHDTSKAQGS